MLWKGRTACADKEYEYEYRNEYDLDLDWGPRQDLCEVILKLRLEEINPGRGNYMCKDP